MQTRKCKTADKFVAWKNVVPTRILKINFQTSGWKRDIEMDSQIKSQVGLDGSAYCDYVQTLYQAKRTPPLRDLISLTATNDWLVLPKV